MKGFAVACGSVPGSDHTKPGVPGWTNNHDAFDFIDAPEYVVAVVSDGCGSTPHPEVGAKLGARLLVKHLSRAALDGIGGNAEICEALLNVSVLKYMTEDLRTIACLLGESEKRMRTFIEMYFLFTTVGVVVTRDYTAVFTFGDGVIAVNGETTIVPPAVGNAPPYIGQVLVPGLMDPRYLKFTVHQMLPTAEVESILIGTDGVRDFIGAERMNLPGKSALVGPVSQFWTDERYVANPDCIRRRLALTNLERIEEVGEQRRIHGGHLKDDTTLAVVKRVGWQ